MAIEINYIILPILIFLARIIDVSLGTIRIIFISKGFKILSALVGFFEVIVWLLAINQILSDFTNIWIMVAYAAGFATGNYIGIILEEKISIGNVLLRIIIKEDPRKLVHELRKNNYHATIMDGKSGYEKTNVKIIFSVISRKKLKKVLKLIKNTNPNAFFTIEDIRNARRDSTNIYKENKKVAIRKHK